MGPTRRLDDLDLPIARLLTLGTYLSVALLVAGVAAMAATGQSPLDTDAGFDAARIPADIAALRPEGFLWLGLVVVIATPSARVAASLVGYLRRADRVMAVVSILILCVIALSVALAIGTEA
ncbi:MAG TPA: DUF1634 domain-containing protein [Candidatus Limnocylindrales bacterium]|nr:DUF1634 domain-containing protein [Candidatus Limnocylindrales bacterium]